VPPRLRDGVRRATEVRHDSIRTRDNDVDCVRLFIVFHGGCRPGELGGAEVAAFQTPLAVDRGVPPAHCRPGRLQAVRRSL
jgi:hypothetical protein